MSPFGAFGFLITGFIVGLAVAFVTGILSAVYIGCKDLINEKVAQDMELARIKHEADMEAVRTIQERILEMLDRKMADSQSFTVKNP